MTSRVPGHPGNKIENAATSELVPTDFRSVCPNCGRFVTVDRVVIDVLTEPGYDIPRDLACCSRCGEVEVSIRPMRLRPLADLSEVPGV